MLHKILTINKYYFSIKLQSIGHCNGTKHFPFVTYKRNVKYNVKFIVPNKHAFFYQQMNNNNNNNNNININARAAAVAAAAAAVVVVVVVVVVIVVVVVVYVVVVVAVVGYHINVSCYYEYSQ